MIYIHKRQSCWSLSKDKMGFSNSTYLKGTCFAFCCKVDVLHEQQSDGHERESVQSYIIKHPYCLISLSANHHRYDQTLLGVWIKKEPAKSPINLCSFSQSSVNGPTTITTKKTTCNTQVPRYLFFSEWGIIVPIHLNWWMQSLHPI